MLFERYGAREILRRIRVVYLWPQFAIASYFSYDARVNLAGAPLGDQYCIWRGTLLE